MQPSSTFWLLVAVLFGCATETTSKGQCRLPTLPSGHEQLMLVTTVNDTTHRGTLQRYERGTTPAWQTVGAEIPVVLGRNGLGWGRGLHASFPLDHPPTKREGDGKSPLGIFTLGTAFGTAERIDTRLSYRQLTGSTECIDEATHPRYNQLVFDTLPRRDWNSSERMLAVGARYELGIFVNHNTPATAGDGSCIFLHVWGGPDVPTSGCTALSRSDLLDLLAWLDPARQPVLVQTTEALLANGLQTSPSERTSRPADPNAPIVVPEDSIARFLRRDLVSELSLVEPHYRTFLYEAHDLDGDDRPEYLVTFQNPYFCGSGGCNLLLLNPDFTLKNRLTVVRQPLYLGAERSDGWRDLIIFSDLATCAGRPHRLVHQPDVGYPSNPSVVPCTDEDTDSLTPVFDTDRTGLELYTF